jgi:adenosine kinase
MSEAREIELAPIVDRVGGVTYVLVGPNDPEGMLRHTNECRKRGYPFIADPSQQLAFGDGEMIRELIDGAAILFSNEYESALIEQKTGWTGDEILERVGTHVITLGAAGVRVQRKGEDPIVVAAVPEIEKVEPTGVGDAFRAGFLAALEWDLSFERAAQLGCLLAVFVVEKVGTQEYTLHQGAFVRRFADSYGEEAAAELAAHVTTPRP